MSRRHPRSSLPRRQLRRESDKTLYDLNERRRVEMSELCDDVRSGRYFRVTRHTSGEDCTQEVLAEVLVAGVPRPGTGGAGAFASMVSNVMTGLIGGIGVNGDELASREKRPQRPVRSASSSLGVGLDGREQPRPSQGRGTAAEAPAVRDSPALVEQSVDGQPVVEQRADRQHSRRATRRKIGLSDAGDRPGGQEEHSKRGSTRPQQVPDRREWWEGD
jgi:hypothetical protein